LIGISDEIGSVGIMVVGIIVLLSGALSVVVERIFVLFEWLMSGKEIDGIILLLSSVSVEVSMRKLINALILVLYGIDLCIISLRFLNHDRKDNSEIFILKMLVRMIHLCVSIIYITEEFVSCWVRYNAILFLISNLKLRSCG
jgi:hypothetical protein